MLSQTEYEYIKGLILNYYDNDYKNYMCNTNNPIASYNQSYYDVYCYFSKGEITKNNNTYNIPSNSIKCSIDTKNTTSSYKLDSLSCISYNGNTEVNTKEFVYSNIEGESNLISEYSSYKFIMISILIILCFIFLYKWITSLFNIRGE